MSRSLDEIRATWDAEAATFDDEPDHGLRDPQVRRAWRDLLLPQLPPAPSRVVDLGCGSGSLTVLLAQAGHHVTGLDVSPEMVRLAREKAEAAGVAASFAVGDASEPDLGPASVDVVLCRHVLWALPDPSAALARWIGLLRPGGRLVLVEGSWSTGAGLTAARTAELVGGLREEVVITPLPEPVYWGRPIEDERYLVVSRH